MANWSKQFTQIDNVNSGREIQITDTPTIDMFNVGLNNTQYLYNLLNLGFIDSISINNSNIVISKKIANGTTTTSSISISDLNGYTKEQVDNFVSQLNQRASAIESALNSVTNRVTSVETRVFDLESETDRLSQIVSNMTMEIIDNATKTYMFSGDSNKHHYLLIPFDNGSNCTIRHYSRPSVQSSWTLTHSVAVRGFVTIRFTSWGVHIYSSVDGQQSFSEVSAYPNAKIEIVVPNDNHWGIIVLGV